MGTLVAFHAHPDDEAISTGGVMAKAAAEGHRVVLVTATRGERGENYASDMNPGEQLWERRMKELHVAADILGVDRVEVLGYVDSGMMGTPENQFPDAFWNADVEEAAKKLANVLVEESADVLTIYDSNGVYGHPDHIQVHRVGARAAEIAGTPKVYEATVDRDQMQERFESAEDLKFSDASYLDLKGIGVPKNEITTVVDVTEFLDRKRAAMAAHGSQITQDSFFLALPQEGFLSAFGQEWFICRGAQQPGQEGAVGADLFEGLNNS